MDAWTTQRLLSAFEVAEPPRSGRPPGLAAVLLTIYDTADGPALLYTTRAEGLRSHPGEISFPGGRVDPDDIGPRQAALREAQEEVGLAPDRLDDVRHLFDYETYRGNMVCAYVARALDPPPTHPASTAEVAEVFTVPIRDLLDARAYYAKRAEMMDPTRRVHYWSIPPRIIWGITGEITAQFLQRACAWQLPANVTTVASVDEFLPARKANGLSRWP